MVGSSNRDEPRPWSLDDVEPPWRGGPSILAHVRAHLTHDDRRLSAAGATLPDEVDDGGLRWVAGGLDGAFGHHVGGGRDRERAERLLDAVRDVLEDATAPKLAALYACVLDASTLGHVDAFLEALGAAEDLPFERLWELATWLAERAPDREAVKLGIAILGGFRAPDQTELLMDLGSHEEFTLFAAVALIQRKGEEAEQDLFTLAQRVHGWGRIQLVERLARTRDPEIKAWMLREGYANSVMNEYLAYTCATAGGLLEALAEPRVDDALLAGAGDIIQALIIGGPAESMDDYEDGAAVVEHYLRHLGPEPRRLPQLLVVGEIAEFLDTEGSWDARASRGWTPALRERLRARCRAIIERPHWPELVRAGLLAEEPASLWVADRAARILGIDTWSHHFERLASGRDAGWYEVMQTSDPARIDRVVALAEARLDLDAIGSGPAKELGLGPAWSQHSHLDFVVQGLAGFPGKGWRLLRAALRSPVVRNRNLALRALAAWGKGAWPEGVVEELERAAGVEPEDGVRERIGRVLAGGPFEDGE